MYRDFKHIAEVGNGSYIYYWQSKELSDEKINFIKLPNHSITPNLGYDGTKIRVEFNGSYLKEDCITFTDAKVVRIYFVYEISKSISISDYPSLQSCLFRAVTLTNIADIDKYKHSGYGIWFDGHEIFSSPGTGLGRNVAIFGVNMSLSIKVDNRKKDILILGKGPTQRLEHTMSAEKMYLINFTEHNKHFCVVCIIIEQTVTYLLIVKKFINWEQKILRL